MKVLVTGGCGFIASHVVDMYIERGYEVIVVDNLSTGKMENLNKRAVFYKMDILSNDLEDILLKEGPELINHHAAQISVPLSVQAPIMDAEINIKGTLHLLELSRRYGVKRFIFASTGGAIYGDATIIPTKEDYNPEPLSPYAISKLSAEKYIRFYHHQYGLDYVILRYSNVFGPRQIPHGEAGVVAIFTERLLAGELPTLYHFPGEPRGMIRDYCYVKDIASANLLATESEAKGIFNIGTGIGTYTLDLYHTIISAMEEKGILIPNGLKNPLTAGARDGDIKISTLDRGKAEQILGFRPKYHLKDGILETIDWYSSKE